MDKLLPVADDFTTESINQFESRLARADLGAHGTGEKGMIEAGEHIFKFYNRNGMNGAKTFWYKNVRIFPIGEMQKILEDEDISVENRLHGFEGGTVERR